MNNVCFINILGQKKEYKIQRSRRAKNIRLRVNVKGQIKVTMPWWASRKVVERFVLSKKDWLAERISDCEENSIKHVFSSGEQLPFLDEQLTILIIRQDSRQRAKVVRENNVLKISLPVNGDAKKAIERWYKQQARIYFAAVSCELSGVINKIGIGDYSSQWGSCSAKGRLAYNWRLLLGPKKIARYVVAHEVAHLTHLNHSKEFWATVKNFDSEYIENRRWLKKNYSLLSW